MRYSNLLIYQIVLTITQDIYQAGHNQVWRKPGAFTERGEVFTIFYISEEKQVDSVILKQLQTVDQPGEAYIQYRSRINGAMPSFSSTC